MQLTCDNETEQHHIMDRGKVIVKKRIEPNVPEKEKVKKIRIICCSHLRLKRKTWMQTEQWLGTSRDVPTPHGSYESNNRKTVGWLTLMGYTFARPRWTSIRVVL